jgi:hypothetical protein
MKVRLSVMFLRMLNDAPIMARPRYGRYRHVPLMKLGGLHLSWCIAADWCLRSHLIVHCSLPQQSILQDAVVKVKQDILMLRNATICFRHVQQRKCGCSVSQSGRYDFGLSTQRSDIGACSSSSDSISAVIVYRLDPSLLTVWLLA